MTLRFLRPRKLGRLVLLLIAGYLAIGYVAPRLRWIPSQRGAEASLAESLPLAPAGVRASGVIHVHTHRSHDAVGDEGEVAGAALDSDVDFVMMGDHRAADAPPGQWQVPAHFVDGVLIIRGQEISLGGEVGRVIVFPLDTVLYDWTAGADELGRYLRETSSTAIVAHSRSPRARDSWRPAATSGIVGWEVFDLADIGRARLADPWVVYHVLSLATSLPIGRGHWSLVRLYRKGFQQPHVAAFDSLYQRAHLTALGGLDAHPKKRISGQLVPPYEPFFKSVVNHVELSMPLPADPDAASAVLANGIRAGSVFISMGDTRLARNFVLQLAVPGGSRFGIGSYVNWEPGLYLRGGFWGGPHKGVLYRVVRDGEPAAWIKGPQLTWVVAAPGAYRVEAYRYTLRIGPLVWNLRPWIFANPFRVTPPEGD
ncbi:MAG TPA: hypothetical protein VLC48_09535 [Gemmatimonadota bacterium]|nr:hypothetical protein [Gemmatimonadota bacterium]